MSSVGDVEDAIAPEAAATIMMTIGQGDLSLLQICCGVYNVVADL